MRPSKTAHRAEKGNKYYDLKYNIGNSFANNETFYIYFQRKSRFH